MGPLAGLKVVEVGGIGPVPFCGMLLADMGAEVTLIERRVRDEEAVHSAAARPAASKVQWGSCPTGAPVPQQCTTLRVPLDYRQPHGPFVPTLKSSDGKFASGMYRSGKSHFEIEEPYGVDEFMYFIEGGVTLTSADGSVQVIGAGEAVTIPKEWTGVWDTDGYTKIWVIYSEDGSGL